MSNFEIPKQIYKMFHKTENNLIYSIIILGLTSMVTQIIVLREFLSVFNGNELVIGVILANWMLLTALGAYIGKLWRVAEFKFDLVILSQILMGLLPIASIYLLYYLRFELYPPGQMLGLTDIILGSFVLLLPFCIVSGSLFTIISTLLSHSSKTNAISKVYAFESFGSILGGLLFNFIFIFILKTFYSLTILLMMNFFMAAFNIFLLNKKLLSYITSVSTIIITLLLVLQNFDHKVLQFAYPDQEIIHHSETPYGKVIITKQNNQYNFYEDGSLTFTSNDVITKEETVHFAMVQHQNPQRVLLISGGYTGTLEEILKYSIKKLDYVELNPHIVDIGKNYTENIIEDKRISIINADVRRFLKKNNNKYDVVLMHSSDPENIHLNRLYTLEFFEELKMHLNDDAVISTSLKSTSNYLSDIASEINASLMATLKLVFKNVIIVQGERNFFLASDKNLSYAITNLINSRAINTIYVNKNYLSDYQIAERGNTLLKTINNKGAINYDFKPIAYFLQLKHWLSYFNYWGYLLALITLIPVLIIVMRMDIVNFGLFITGFSSSAMEVILIIGFQVIFGYIYHTLGILITIFMAGLALGSYFVIKKVAISYKTYSLTQYLIGIISILTPLILFTLQHYAIHNLLIHLVFMFLLLIIGILTGIQFSLASKLKAAYISEIAANAYSSELLGGAIGAIGLTTVMIPLLGLMKVSLIVGILNIITGLLILLKMRNPKKSYF